MNKADAEKFYNEGFYAAVAKLNPKVSTVLPPKSFEETWEVHCNQPIVARLHSAQDQSSGK